jgi:acyl-CoA dehydrogenase
MAVRTGGPDSKANGLSLLLVPLANTEGVSMRRFKVAGHVAAGTTFIDLDEVKVPVSNLIGEENQGMKYIMTNFNHERLSICIGGTRQARVALGAAMEYVMQREAFGKTLVDQPVVRHRLAICGGMVEAQWSWVEQITYMMSKMKKVDVSCLPPPM